MLRPLTQLSWINSNQINSIQGGSKKVPAWKPQYLNDRLVDLNRNFEDYLGDIFTYSCQMSCICSKLFKSYGTFTRRTCISLLTDILIYFLTDEYTSRTKNLMDQLLRSLYFLLKSCCSFKYINYLIKTN